MKKLGKKITAVVTLAMAFTLGFNSSIGAHAETLKFFVQKENENIADGTTTKVTDGQDTKKFTSYGTAEYDGQISENLNENESCTENYYNEYGYYDTGAVEEFLKDVQSVPNTTAEDMYINWYVIKHENDGWHVDGKIQAYNTSAAYRAEEAAKKEAAEKEAAEEAAKKEAAEKEAAEKAAKEAQEAADKAEKEAADKAEADRIAAEEAAKKAAQEAEALRLAEEARLAAEEAARFAAQQAAYQTPSYVEIYIPPYVEPATEVEEVIATEEVATTEAAPEVEEEETEVVEEIVPETEELEVEAEEVEEVTEEVVDIDEVETAQSAVEEETEEEELELEETETPQSLPQTGVASAVVLYGLGSACMGFGSAIILKASRKEEE